MALRYTLRGLSTVADNRMKKRSIHASLLQNFPPRSLFDLGPEWSSSGRQAGLDPQQPSFPYPDRRQSARMNFDRHSLVRHGVIAERLQREGDLEGALTSFRRSVAAGKPLLHTHPDIADLLHSLSISYSGMGGVLSELGQQAKALHAYQISLTIRRFLVELVPTNLVWQNDLACTYCDIGNVLTAEKKPDAALQAHRDSLAIREHLLQEQPRDIRWLRLCAVSHYHLAILLLKDDLPTAGHHLKRCHTTLMGMLREGFPLDPFLKGLLDWLDGRSPYPSIHL